MEEAEDLKERRAQEVERLRQDKLRQDKVRERPSTSTARFIVLSMPLQWPATVTVLRQAKEEERIAIFEKATVRGAASALRFHCLRG